MRDGLGDSIVVQPLGPAFAAMARIFDPAERHFRHRCLQRVDRQVASLDPAGHLVNIGRRMGKPISRKAKRQGIGAGDGE